MKEEFTQGTIMANVRSKKYKDTKCKGVVISARCDFAQKKISNFHYVTALPLEVWIYEELYYRIIEDIINSEEGNIKKIAEKNKLDYETLRGFGYEKSKIIFEKTLSSKDASNVISKIEKCILYSELYKNKDTKEKKKCMKQYIPEKTIKDYIRRLINGAYPKFTFVPQNSYLNNNILNNGIVVDLQDVNQLDIQYAIRILENDLDYQLIQDEVEREKINRFFFFEDVDDFVISEGTIDSPWIEYVLQQFGNTFMRIGVENATQYEIDDFYSDFIMEE